MRSSMGSMRTTFCASAGPSRRTKNSTNSISRKLTRVPSAPSTNVPPDDARNCSTCFARSDQPALDLCDGNARVLSNPVERIVQPWNARQVQCRGIGRQGRATVELLQQLRGLGGDGAGDHRDGQHEQDHRQRGRDRAREPGAATQPVGEPPVPRCEQRAEQRGPEQRLPQRRDDAPGQVAERREQQHAAQPEVETARRAGRRVLERDRRFADVFRCLAHSMTALDRLPGCRTVECIRISNQ